MPGLDRPHLGSLVCAAGHELRITGRCVTDDLGSAVDSPFQELEGRHDIIRAFRRERSTATAGPDHLGSDRSPRPLTVLRHANDWRGVTWFDDRERVVWLCACAWHRSGQPDDAFPYFKSLQADNLILPTPDDYVALASDRGAQFAAFVVDDAPRLLAMAREAPGTEQVLIIGLEPVSAVVHVVETLEQTFVAISMIRIDISSFQLLLVAMYPDRKFDEWKWEQRLPTRDLDIVQAEMCLSIIHG